MNGNLRFMKGIFFILNLKGNILGTGQCFLSTKDTIFRPTTQYVQYFVNQKCKMNGNILSMEGIFITLGRDSLTKILYTFLVAF
jgi:hypothetical protein